MPTPIQSTTQEHLEIEDIVDNLVIIKDGSVAMVAATTAVNFGLLSEAEQDATIYGYAALLNSLTFPIQILIRSSRKDISGYERLLEEQERKATNPENRERIRKYKEFVQETVRERNVLDKKFYIVIPFSVLELGVTKSASVLAKGGRSGLPFAKDYIIKRSKMTLEPKFDHLSHQLGRLGLKARQLTTKELIQLMFELYNPDSAKGQMFASPEEYQTPLVKPAVAFKESPQIESPQSQEAPSSSQVSGPQPQPSPVSSQNQPIQPPSSAQLIPQSGPQTATPSSESPALKTQKAAESPLEPAESESNLRSPSESPAQKAQDLINQAVENPPKSQS